MDVNQFNLEIVQRLAKMEQALNNHIPTDIARVERAFDKLEARVNFLILSIVVAVAVEVFRWVTK